MTGPELHAIQVDSQTLFLATGNGIEEPDALDETAITGIALIGNGDVVERLLLGTGTSQSNSDHKRKLPELGIQTKKLT
jgi:hypothetical protein